MAKQITFDHKEITYTLEFTRKSIETMERKGFIASDLVNKPVSMLPELFAGSFIAHHRFTKADVIEKIFNQFTNKDRLIEKLSEMYNEPIEAMLGEPTEEEGNVKWGVSW